MSTVRYTNDGSDAAPRLVPYLNMGNLADLPDWSAGPRGGKQEVYSAIKTAGFEGVQGDDPATALQAGLGCAGGGRINAVGEADDLCKQLNDAGFIAGTLHVGWGIEDDDQVDALVGDIIDASVKHDMPLYIETHRATITQDIWRTVKLIERFPGVRFNGDFSHWYTGLEMPYGTVELKTDFAAPVFDRIGFMHGRIGNSGCIQVDIGPDLATAKGHAHVQHFMEMWTLTMMGFIKNAGPGETLIFAPELLQPAINYARAFPDSDGQPREESDRWQQALLYVEIASECFEAARERVSG